jgi:hypothetical protein
MYNNTHGQQLAACIKIHAANWPRVLKYGAARIKIHAANCAVSLNRVGRVYLRGDLHAANSSPRVQ